MSKSKKLVLLCVTSWPLIYLIFGFMFFLNISLVEITQLPPSIIIAQIITTTILLGLIIGYSVHLYKNSEVHDESKLMWFIGFLVAGALVTIFYWKKFIW